MSKNNTFNTVYKLGGRALEAARRLDAIVQEAYQAAPMDWQGKDLLTIQRMGQDFSNKLLARLEREEPELLKTLGLDHPVTRVITAQDSWPRAYEVYPDVFASPTNPPSYYMYCPVDYKNTNFFPDDSRKLDSKEEQAAGDLLFAGGWLGNAPLLSRGERGVALPADFDPAWANTIDQSGPYEGTTKRVYKAAGRSLHVVQDYLRRKDTYDNATSALFKALQGLAQELADNYSADADWAKEHEVYMNLMMGTNKGGRPAIELSVRSSDLGGEVIPVGENPYFTITGMKHGNLTIAPKRTTEEGKALAKLFDAVPSRPELSQYWQLWNPTAPGIKDEFNLFGKDHWKAPMLKSDGDAHYLIYTIDPDNEKDASRPPDAEAIDLKEYTWQEKNREDIQRGIEPPPHPSTTPERGQQGNWLCRQVKRVLGL